MLEKIKTLYNPIPGMPADKIGPTVGQNSKSPTNHLPSARAPLITPRLTRRNPRRHPLGAAYSRQDFPSFDHAPLFRPRRSKGYPTDLGKVLRRVSCRRLCRRCGGSRQAERMLGSLWSVQFTPRNPLGQPSPGTKPTIEHIELNINPFGWVGCIGLGRHGLDFPEIIEPTPLAPRQQARHADLALPRRGA